MIHTVSPSGDVPCDRRVTGRMQVSRSILPATPKVRPRDASSPMRTVIALCCRRWCALGCLGLRSSYLRRSTTAKYHALEHLFDMSGVPVAPRRSEGANLLAASGHHRDQRHQIGDIGDNADKEHHGHQDASTVGDQETIEVWRNRGRTRLGRRMALSAWSRGPSGRKLALL